MVAGAAAVVAVEAEGGPDDADALDVVSEAIVEAAVVKEVVVVDPTDSVQGVPASATGSRKTSGPVPRVRDGELS